MELFPIPCCCERSVDMKVFEKENKAVALNTNSTKSIPLRRSLSSKIRAKLKESMYAASRFSEDGNRDSHCISSPRSNVCAFMSCQRRVEEKHKQTVILSRKKMHFCSFQCWEKWLITLNEPYKKENKKRPILMATRHVSSRANSNAGSSASS